MGDPGRVQRRRDRPAVLFRVDGGRIWGVSLGHVFRCLALAGELRKRYGIPAGFLMRGDETAVGLVREHGFPVRVLDREIGYDQEITLMEERPEAVVVFDLIDVTARDTGRLRRGGKRVVVIDDTGGKRIDADVIVNGSIVPEFRRYPADGREARYYLGPRYCVLGEEFDGESPRPVSPQVEMILVSMGGSDPAGLTERVARCLARTALPCRLMVVLGPGFRGREAVVAALRPYRGSWTVVESPPLLAPLMRAADLVILAGGRTAYEAACLGVPGVLIPSIEHEEQVVEAFAREGAFLSLAPGWRLPEEAFARRLEEALTRLLMDRALRERMARRARQLVDGRGRARIAAVIHELVLRGEL